MATWQYTKGLHDIGNGVYTYLQPDGSWGWSNAGLVVDGDQSMLVDPSSISSSLRPCCVRCARRRLRPSR